MTSPIDLQIGFLGLDSSHCTAFADILKSFVDPELEGAAITHGWPGGTEDFELSRSRVKSFTQEMQTLGVEIHDSPQEVIRQSDALILGCVDGRQHEPLAELVLSSGKPVFIDKPLAHSFEAASRIVQTGREQQANWFTASALRYQTPLLNLRTEIESDIVISCDVYGTLREAVGHATLAWYGIHGIEAMYSVLGPGCHSVSRIRTSHGDVTTGVWADGRIGTFRGLNETIQKIGFGMAIHCQNSIHQFPLPADYENLVRTIVKFFRTGTPPVDPTESLEIMAFIQAADISLSQAGRPVPLSQL